MNNYSSIDPAAKPLTLLYMAAKQEFSNSDSLYDSTQELSDPDASISYDEFAPIFTSIAMGRKWSCAGCNAEQTPQKRNGPYGASSLCNACGLCWAKLVNQQITTQQCAICKRLPAFKLGPQKVCMKHALNLMHSNMSKI